VTYAVALGKRFPQYETRPLCQERLITVLEEDVDSRFREVYKKSPESFPELKATQKSFAGWGKGESGVVHKYSGMVPFAVGSHEHKFPHHAR
jgi:hypothetical protein